MDSEMKWLDLEKRGSVGELSTRKDRLFSQPNQNKDHDAHYVQDTTLAPWTTDHPIQNVQISNNDMRLGISHPTYMPIEDDILILTTLLHINMGVIIS